MCVHGEHDRFAYEGEMSKDVVACIAIGYGMACRFGGGEKMGTNVRILEISGRTCEEGCAWRAKAENKRTGINVQAKDRCPLLILAQTRNEVVTP